MLNDFEQHYAISRVSIGPGDPIENSKHSIREMIAASQSTTTITDVLQKQAEYAQQYASQLWNQVLRDVGMKQLRN
jgi:hypothetical protein